MPINSKIRLEQLTGSVAVLKPGSLAQGTAAAIKGTTDMNDVLKYYSQAISNIHGNVEYGAQLPGAFSATIFPATDGVQDLGKWGIANTETFGNSLGSLDSSGFSVGSATPDTTMDASITRIHLGSSATVQANDLFLFRQSGGLIMVYQKSGSTSTGDQHDVLFNAGLSTIFAMNQSTIDSQRIGNISLVEEKEWGKAVVAAIQGTAGLAITNGQKTTASDILVQSSRKLSLNSLDTDSSGGVVLENQASVGKIRAKIAGVDKFILDTSDFKIQSTVNVDVLSVVDAANATDAAAAMTISGGVAVAKKYFGGDDLAVAVDSKKLTIGSTNPILLQHGAVRSSLSSAAQMAITGSTGVQILSNASLVLSGAAATSFCSNDIKDFTFGGASEGGLVLGVAGEAAAYQAAFGVTNKSILGALTDLKTAAAGSLPTSYAVTVAAAGASAGAALALGSPTGGTAQDLRPANKAAVDVFVNGQRLLSGSAAAPLDYIVDGAAAQQIKIQFALIHNDVVQVLDRQ